MFIPRATRITLLGLLVLALLAACGTAPNDPDPDRDPDPRPLEACTEPDQVVTFPDAHLRSFIYLRLGISDGEPILCGALDAVTQLNLSATRPVTSLAGVEHLKNINRISLTQQNTLPDAEFQRLAHMTGVTSLSIDRAALLRSIKFVENMELLATLAIDDTGLESLEGIEDLQALRFMYVRGNPSITSAEPVANLRSLESVQLTGSGVTSLAPFTGNPTLQRLMATNNALTSVDVRNMPSLEEFQVTSNRISSLPSFSSIGMPRLTVLSVANNNLTTLAGLEGMRLSFLAAGGNKLTTIHHIADLAGIRTLYLQDNLLSNVTALRGMTWASSGFRVVHLNANCIEEYNGVLPLGPNNDTFIELRGIDVNINYMPQATDGRCI